MSPQSAQTTVDVPYVRAVSILTSRPARWLRGFLQLAVAPNLDPHTDTSPQWFRLGPEVADRPGVTVMTLTWWPHTRAVFDRFGGELVIAADGAGVSLSLTGLTRGGAVSTNTAVLNRLVTLLGQALTAAQDEG
jgi:hypothetical protein